MASPPGPTTLSFAVRPSEGSDRIHITRTGVEGRCVYPTPDHPKRRRHRATKNQIIDWRVLLGLAIAPPPGNRLAYGLPLLVLLGAHRRRLKEARTALFPLQNLLNTFPHSVQTDPESFLWKLRKWHTNAAARSLPFELVGSRLDDEADPVQIGLKPDISVSFHPFEDIGLPEEANSAEDFAVAWLRCAAARSLDLQWFLPDEQIPLPPPPADKASPPPPVVTEPIPTNARPPQPVNVPGRAAVLPVANFCGRTAEMKLLRDACSIGSSKPCIIVWGMPGVGKTSIVREFVARDEVALSFEYIGWHGVESLPEAILDAAQNMGWEPPRPQSVHEAARWLTDQLARRRALLVFDSVPRDADTSLLPVPTRGSRIILTTQHKALRESFDYDTELIHVSSWDRKTSREYLRLYAGPNPASDTDLDTLSQRVGFLPLALRILGSELRRDGMTAAILAKRISVAPLRTLGHNNAGRHARSVARVIEQAVRQLNSVERSVFIACSVCAKRTTPEIVAGIAKLSEDLALDALGSLAGCGLVEHSGASERPWGMHDLLRSYAEDMTGWFDAAVAHVELVNQRCLKMSPFAMEGLAKESDTLPHSATLRLVARADDLQEVLTAVNRASRYTDPEISIALIMLVANQLIEQGNALELAQYLSGRPPPSNTSSLAWRYHMMLGRCRARLFEFDNALWYFERAGSLMQKAEPAIDKALLYERWGHCLVNLGKHKEATDQFRQAIKLFLIAEATVGAARVVMSVASLAALLHGPSAAREMAAHSEALLSSAHVTESSDIDEPGADLLPDVYALLGDLSRAATCAEKRVTFWRSRAASWATANELLRLGTYLAASARYHEALGCYSEAATLFRSVGDVLYEATAVTYTARVEGSMGNSVAARGSYHMALGLLGGSDDDQVLAALRSLLERVLDVVDRGKWTAPNIDYFALVVRSSLRSDFGKLD